MKKKIEQMYLDFFNDFITVEYFAEYHGITVVINKPL